MNQAVTTAPIVIDEVNCAGALSVCLYDTAAEKRLEYSSSMDSTRDMFTDVFNFDWERVKSAISEVPEELHPLVLAYMQEHEEELKDQWSKALPEINAEAAFEAEWDRAAEADYWSGY